MPPIPQFVAGQRVLLPTSENFDALHEKRLGVIEHSAGPARFELVSDPLMPVATGRVADMLINRDMDQYHLIDAGIWVYAVSAADIEVNFYSRFVGGYLLDTNLVLPTGDTFVFADLLLVQILAGLPLPAGDVIEVDVIDAGSGGTGLGATLSYA